MNDPIVLSAKRTENAYLHSLVTRQAQTIDELLDLADQLVAAAQAGHVPGLTTAADLRSLS